MTIRKVSLCEVQKAEELYSHGREFMRANGNSEQWSCGYPSTEIIKDDIEKGHLYFCEDDSGVVAVFCYFFSPDSTYDEIYFGEWLNSEDYGVIHRIAVSKESHGRGVAKFIYDSCFEKCKNLKIDTHRDNIPMQKSLAKNGFVRCGIIHLANGDERIAYQRIK